VSGLTHTTRLVDAPLDSNGWKQPKDVENTISEVQTAPLTQVDHDTPLVSEPFLSTSDLKDIKKEYDECKVADLRLVEKSRWPFRRIFDLWEWSPFRQTEVRASGDSDTTLPLDDSDLTQCTESPDVSLRKDIGSIEDDFYEMALGDSAVEHSNHLVSSAPPPPPPPPLPRHYQYDN
jgi:hypothetical protein